MKDHYSESNQQKENISIGPANQRAGDGKNNERRSVSQSLRYDVQTLLDLRGNSTAVKPPDPAIQELLNDGENYSRFVSLDVSDHDELTVSI